MIDIVKLRTIYLTMQKLSAGENPFSPENQLSLDNPKAQQCLCNFTNDTYECITPSVKFVTL